jgi:hypothetical protein
MAEAADRSETARFVAGRRGISRVSDIALAANPSPLTGPRRAVLTSLAIVGVGLVILGTYPFEGVVWSEAGLGRLRIDVPDWVVAVAAVSMFAAAVLIVIVLARLRRHAPPLPSPETLWDRIRRAVTFVATLALIVLLVHYGRDFLRRLQERIAELQFGQGLGEIDVEAIPDSVLSPLASDLVSILILLVAMATLAGAGWIAYAVRFGGIEAPDAADGTPAELAAAVEESLDDLGNGGEPRQAIIRCYARFELALAKVRLPRRPWQTATEFMHSVLRSMPLPAEQVSGLTSLFELAKFSDHVLGEAERDEAWQALSAIKASLDSRQPHA